MHEGVEAELEALLRKGSLSPAATRAIEAYGPELFGFLLSLLGDEGDAKEVFSEVTEDLWRGLPKFGFRCSLRTWLYVLARHAAASFRRAPWNHAGGEPATRSSTRWSPTHVRAHNPGYAPTSKIASVRYASRSIATTAPCWFCA
jgi:DNA-directed RNA polymerase specialized sigma24 family protein